MARAAAAVLVAGVVASCGTPGGVPVAPVRHVLVYGDSLTFESAAELRAAVALRSPGAVVEVRAWPGSAQCDWHPDMLAERGRFDVVVLAFYGNRITPCITSRDAAVGYEEDLRGAVALWRARGTRVAVVGTPPKVGEGPQGPTRTVARTYLRVAGELGLWWVDAAGAFTGDDGLAAQQVVCRDDEGAAQGCADGVVPVRNADGVHLCDATAVVRCETYAPGRVRYAEAIADVAGRALTGDSRQPAVR